MADFGSVLNRTTGVYIEYAELSEDKYPTDEWIHDPDLSAVECVMLRYWLISGDDVFEMSQGQKEAEDAADLALFKSTRKDDLLREMREYIGGKYPPIVFAMLNSLDAEAVALSYSTRRVYIDGLRGWFRSIQTEYASDCTSIDACTTLEQMLAIGFDWSVYDASDPAITVKGAMDLLS